jgi:hypothetical protein
VSWAPGERERVEFFYSQRAARLSHRAMLMGFLGQAYNALFDNYAALLRRNLVEDDYEDTIPPTNQNVW